MKNFFILLKKDFMELYRTKKMLVLTIAFLVFAVLSPIITYITPDLLKAVAKDSGVIINLPPVTYIDAYIQLFKNLSQICLFVLVIVFASLIVEERIKGTYTNLVNNNVRPYHFVLSKIISQALTFTVIYIISMGVFMMYTAFLFDKFLAPHYLIALLSYYFYVIFLIGLINLASAIAKSTVMGIVIGFIFMFGLMILDLAPKIGKYLPNYLTSIGNNVMTDFKYLSYFAPNVIISMIILIGLVTYTIKLCRNVER